MLDAGQPLRSGPLTVVPLHAEPPEPGLDYLTLDEAAEAGTLTISELSRDGEVPALRVEVSGDRPVLLVEGEILLGGKQNRILNTTVLARAGDVTEIPVSCVEAGRWSRASDRMAPGSSGSSKLRRTKTLSVTDTLIGTPPEAKPNYASDQGAVWREVSDCLEETRSASATGSLQAAYATHADMLMSGGDLSAAMGHGSEAMSQHYVDQAGRHKIAGEMIWAQLTETVQ